MGSTGCVVGGFRVRLVSEEPEIVVVAVGIEGDLLLIGTGGVHMIVGMKITALQLEL